MKKFIRKVGISILTFFITSWSLLPFGINVQPALALAVPVDCQALVVHFPPDGGSFSSENEMCQFHYASMIDRNFSGAYLIRFYQDASNTNPGSADTVSVTITSTSDPVGVTAVLTEVAQNQYVLPANAAVNTGIFAGSFVIAETSNGAATPVQIAAIAGDTLTVTHAGSSSTYSETVQAMNFGNDLDWDGIADGTDNCPNIPNANQTDTDVNGVGDACENSFAIVGYGPPNGMTNMPTMAPLDFMLSAAPSASAQSSLSSYFSVTPSVSGSWSYFSETWGAQTMHRVSFMPTSGLAVGTSYTVSALKAVTNAANNALTSAVPPFMPALTETDTAYTFSITTAATATQGGFFPPLVKPGYPQEGQRDISTSTAGISINFDRENMDATTFAGNITLTKVGADVVAGTSVVPTTGSSGVATLKNFTLLPSSQYTVTVTNAVKDTNGQPIVTNNGTNFVYSFFTGSSSASTTSAYTGSNLNQYSSGGVITGVPTGIVIHASFSNPLDAATVNATNVRVLDGATPVAGTVVYDAMGNVIRFTPNAALTTNTAYTLSINNSVLSISGTAITAISTAFTTTAVADTAKPRFITAEADNYGFFLEFSEPLKRTTAENKSNFTIKTRADSTAWSSVTATSLTSANVRYVSEDNAVTFDGLSLTPGQEFQVTVSTNVLDIADNAMDDAASANVRTGFIMDASKFFGGSGMFTMGDMGMADFNMDNMGMMPVNVMPMNNMAGLSTKYFVNIPTSVGIPANGTIELKFPSGFTITGVRRDAQSPMNADFNRPGVGNVVTFAATDPTATTTNGVDNDGIGLTGDRTVVIKLSAATLASDFLAIDLDAIVNSNIPKDFDSTGYQVEIKTKDTAGLLLEALNSMPFFITGGGTNTINGEVHGIAVGDDDTMSVYLASPMTGPMPQIVTITGTGNATADGAFSFTGLPDGEYFIFTDPNISLNAGNYHGSVAPDSIRVAGGATVSRNITLQKDGDEAATYTVTVRLVGDFRTAGVNDNVDIFAGSPTGFRVKTVTPGNTAGTNYTLYLPDGDWFVGVGPAMPTGPMTAKPIMPDWMPPAPLNIKISSAGTVINEKSATANDGTLLFNLGAQSVNTVTGEVVDDQGNGIAEAEVFAYQPTGGFGGANTKSSADGTFTLKVPVTGMYSVGAFKPGLPEGAQQSVNVQGNVSDVIIKMKKPAYTISGKVLNSSGVGVSYVPVWTYNPSGFGHSETMTDSTGKYILYVDNGNWMVETDIPGNGWVQYASAVGVSGASVANINLRPNADYTFYTITGNISINGQNMTYMPIRAVEFNATGAYLGREFGGSTDSSGNYTISVLGPVGVETQKLYRVDIWTPEYGEVAANNLDGDATPGEAADDQVANNPANVIISDANKTNVNVLVAAADVNTVTVLFSNKADYSSQRAFINVDGYDQASGKPTGFHKTLTVSDISGLDQTVKLPDGNYHVFVDVPGYGGFVPNEVKFDAATTPGYFDVGDASTDNNTLTIALPDLDDTSAIVTVSGTVSSGGTGVANAWVWVGNPGTGFHKGMNSNGSGEFSFSLPILASGNYVIGADKSGYMSLQPVTVVTTDTTPADGVADAAVALTLTSAGQSISGFLYADRNGGTANTKDAGEEIANGWVYAEEINTKLMVHAPVDGTGAYTLSVSNGDWKVYGAGDGYLQSQYTEAGSYKLITVSGVNQTSKHIKLSVDTNWTTASKNKPMTPSSGGVVDDTGTGGTGVKLTVPANALGSSSSQGSVSVNQTASVTKTNTAQPFGGKGMNITASDNAGQPITSLNDYVDLEMLYYKADIDAEIAAGTIADVSKIKTMQVSYFDSTVNDWVFMSTIRTAYYKTDADDTEWKVYAGDATKTGFEKFVDDALVDGTFTAFEDYKLEFKSSTNHFTIFGVTMPADGDAPAAPTALTQTAGNGTSVTLDWASNSEGDLMEYEVYRATTTGVSKTSTQINTSQLMASAFTDTTTTEWTSYFYTVTAADDSGNESTIATELQVCSTSSVTNGTVANTCAITCNTGYTQSGNSCASSGSGGGGTSFITNTPSSTPTTPLPDSTNTDMGVEEEAEATPVVTPEETASPSITQILQRKVYDLKEMAQDAITVSKNNLDLWLVDMGLKKDTLVEANMDIVVKKITGIDQADKKIADAIDNFVTYGTASTFKMGAGERAGVVNSFQAAFGRLPQTEADWTDVVKIANGRWPTQTSAAREVWAGNIFKSIYLREPNRKQAHDDAAVVIIAYGLRPVDRNLASERIAIRHFKAIFGYEPTDTEDWDTVRAIAYSGATR